MKTSKKCFLIDDDLDDQDIFLMALQEIDKNIECVMASDGVEGIKILSEEALFIPDYIFVDINMPKMNGMQCLPEIRKLPHLKSSKIIMLSTSTDARIIAASKEMGAADFMVKPPSFALLTETLSKILER